MINANDTITLYMSNTGIKDYLLKIEGFDFVQTGIPARLVDRFMGTITNLDLRGNNNYDFSITADPASAVADRFQIIFGVKKADIVTGEKGITIYPNPVSNKLINMKFIDMEKGVYTLRLINTKGQVVMTTSVNHSGTNSIQIATLDQRIANGLYRMEFIKPDKSKIVMALVILNK